MINDAMNYLIETKDVHKTYRMGTGRIEVLRGVDLAVRPGDFLAVVGASGSGKSTLLHILGALDRPDKGQVFFKGTGIHTFGTKKINYYRNKSVGFVFQFYHLLDELTVLENTMLAALAAMPFPAPPGRKKYLKSRARELLDMMGLAEREKHRPYQLSGGERQRTAIARALMNGPELLVADEPTGNLDSETGDGILRVLERFNADGQTIVMVTHDDRIADTASKVIRLTDGKIVEDQNQPVPETE